MNPDLAARYRRLADKERWATIVATCPIDPTTGCRLWPRAKSLGYGRIKFDGRLDLAHRVAYRLAVGPVPAGKVLDHLCRNPSCINPEHLEPVTMRENILRGTGPAAFNPSRHRDPEARSMDRFAIVDLDAWIARMRVEARVQSFAAPAPLSPSGAVECEPRSGVGTPPAGPSSPERAA